MATRRDYTRTAEVLRSTPMPAALRHTLAERMADAYTETSTGFDASKFVHESTRPNRPGESPTISTDLDTVDTVDTVTPATRHTSTGPRFSDANG